LRARGIDASTAGETGRLGSSDAAVLAQAKTDGRVLITADADYLRLHAAGVPHAGIVFARADASIGVIIGGAMLVAEVLTSDEMMNHVEFL
jgi:predicted nuclease of predicted toxin-antitoxin system